MADTRIIDVKTIHIYHFKVLFEVLKEIIHCTTLRFCGGTVSESKKKGDKGDKGDKDKFRGIKILNASDDKSIIVSVKLHSDYFSQFNCSQLIFDVGVNLVPLYDTLRSMEKEEEMSMYVDSCSKQKLVISSQSEKDRRQTQTQLNLLDITPEINGLPDIQPDVLVTMNSSDFQRLCKEMAQIGQYLEIRCTENTLIFSCSGSNSSREVRYEFDKNGTRDADAKNAIKIVIAGKSKHLIIQGIYDLRSLNLFTKCTSLSTNLEISITLDKKSLLTLKYVFALGEFMACLTQKSAEKKPLPYKSVAGLYAEKNIILNDDRDGDNFNEYD